MAELDVRRYEYSRKTRASHFSSLAHKPLQIRRGKPAIQPEQQSYFITATFYVTPHLLFQMAQQLGFDQNDVKYNQYLIVRLAKGYGINFPEGASPSFLAPRYSAGVTVRLEQYEFDRLKILLSELFPDNWKIVLPKESDTSSQTAANPLQVPA